VRRIFGVGLAVPFGGLAVILVVVSAGSVLERVYFAALPALLALRFALGKGRAPGLLVIGAAGTLGSLFAALLTSHPIGDTPYPWVERVRYGVLLSGVAALPLVALVPLRGRVARLVTLVVALVAYAPLAFIALQVHRPHVRASWNASSGAEPRRVEVEAPDGTALRGWSWAGRTDRSPLVVLLHGIGSSRQDLVHLGRVYRSRGWAVGMFDSRGHGESDSMTVTFGLRERADVRAIVEHLTRRDRAIPVALHGCSMGAAIALQAAAELPQVRAVVAEAPFYDLSSMARSQLAGLPSPVVGLGMAVFRGVAPLELGGSLAEVSPALAIARRPELRSLIIVGGRDHVVPVSHGRRLHRRAAGPSELWELPDAQHCSAWAAAPEEFPRRVSDVLRAAFRVVESYDDPGRPVGRGGKAPASEGR
jgi:alpha-beta hydrolase superfamily lysophospholipase